MNKQQNKQKLETTHIYIHISCKCDTNRAGHFTLDAHASRPVACVVVLRSSTPEIYSLLVHLYSAVAQSRYAVCAIPPAMFN